MEINHCYPDSSDSSLSSSNQQKHLRSPCAAFCKMSWGVDGKGGDKATLGVDGRWGAALEEMVISTSHQCAGAPHKPLRAVSKCC